MEWILGLPKLDSAAVEESTFNQVDQYAGTEIVYGSVHDGRFGIIVSVAADRVAVTERFAAVDDVVRAGTVWLYTMHDQGLVPSGKIIGELDRYETFFGNQLGMDAAGQVLAIGVPFGAGNGGQGGSVYLFDLSRLPTPTE